MNSIEIPFSLFDFFAVLLPGAVGIGGLYLFFNPSLSQTGQDSIFSNLVLQRLEGDLVVLTGLVLASFLMGQVQNAIAELLIDKPLNGIFGSHIRHDLAEESVQQAFKGYFGVEITKPQSKNQFAMMQSIASINVPDVVANAQRYIALAVMFESLALALLLVAIALIVGYKTQQVFSGNFWGIFWVVVFLLAVIALMLWSYRRFKSMWSRTFCMCFVAWVTGSGNVDGKKPAAA